MILIIPLGGIGERFKKNGYDCPKALVKVFGRPILYYLIDNLDTSKLTMIYIPYNKEYAPYRLEDLLQKEYPHLPFQFLRLEENTRGAAETINKALKRLSISDCPILTMDCDNFYTFNIIDAWNGTNKIFTIIDHGSTPIYSYIKLNGASTSIINDIIR